jgi:hypothetical protein
LVRVLLLHVNFVARSVGSCEQSSCRSKAVERTIAVRKGCKQTFWHE